MPDDSYSIPIIDGHNDTVLNLHLPERGQGRSFFEQSTVGHVDLPRAQAGNLAGGFFAVFAPNQITLTDTDAAPRMAAIEKGYARDFSLALCARLFKMEADSNGQFRVVRGINDLRNCLENGVLASILHFEGAEAFDTDLDTLHVLYQAGLRSLGIVWSRPNAFGAGVPFAFPGSPDIGPGLSTAGKRLVRTCNQLGVMVDVSHLNEKGFWDVEQISDAPIVATHCGVHALSASPRNLTDKQLDAIGASNGVVGINFHVGFLRADGKSDVDTPLELIVQHAMYIADRIGIDHVALGSDFDGAQMPRELGDVAGLPKLMEAFRSYGLDNDALRTIAFENWLRVLKTTWR